ECRTGWPAYESSPPPVFGEVMRINVGQRTSCLPHTTVFHPEIVMGTQDKSRNTEANSLFNTYRIRKKMSSMIQCGPTPDNKTKARRPVKRCSVGAVTA
ncbi:hypothetical protein, partial [Amorphus sp. MBR-141]